MSMPEAAKRKNLDALRVYAPSRGNLAIENEALPYTRVAEPATKVDIRHRPFIVPKPVSVPKKTIAEHIKDNHVFAKLTAVLCVCLVALSLLVMISGYNSISAAQREMNALTKRVADMESIVEKTNVEYLFSIDVNSAHEAAGSVGMIYPINGGSGN